jgi:hypothetical protein
MRQVTATTIPMESVLYAAIPGSDFHDAFEAPLDDPTLSLIAILLRAFRTTPQWVGTLMSLRNSIVRPLGLKGDAGLSEVAEKPTDAYRIGDRIGIFTIMASSETELLLGIDDSHLDVRVSVMKRHAGDTSSFVLSSLVNIRNWLGRAYMVPVGRIHPFVVRAMMRRVQA